VAESDVVIGLNREFLVGRETFVAEAETNPLGAFFAFVTTDDPHSVVMLPVYDEIVDHYENKIPLFVIDARDEGNADLLDLCLIYSVPTFIYTKVLADSKGVDRPNILVRQMGTVMKRKLTREIDPKIDLVLASL
jgi:thiol-disulfide isomerase/thioredoxin